MFDIIHEKSAANNEVSVRVPKHNNFFIDIRSCNFGGSLVKKGLAKSKLMDKFKLQIFDWN